MSFDDELTPAERRLRARTATRPTRSPVVWSVALALTLLGTLGLAYSALLLQDLTSHGEEGAVVALAATAVLVSAIQAASGIGVLVGAGWSLGAARTTCVVGLLAGILALLNEAPPATAVGLLVNVSLLVALSGEKLRAWCA